MLARRRRSMMMSCRFSTKVKPTRVSYPASVPPRIRLNPSPPRHPVWRRLVEADLAEARGRHHAPDLGTGVPPLEPGAEPVQGIGPHRVEAQPGIDRQWQ